MDTVLFLVIVLGIAGKPEVIPHGGHFLSLDRPQEVIRLLRGFAKV